MKNLTAIYWIKNEARYLPEWIEFHLIQGFDYFIFYDNKSDDNLYEVMNPYINAGIVEIRNYPQEVDESGQSKNYWVMSHCIDEQKNKSKWIHFHAIDEFTYCPDGRKINELLKEFDQFGGLAVNWKLFGPGKHVSRPEGLVIENYTRRFKYDRDLHVKTIIQPLKTKSPAPNTHFFDTDIVDENYVPVYGPFNGFTENIPPLVRPNLNYEPKHYTFNKICNNHYVTRSVQEFNEKNNKGLLDHGKVSEVNRRDPNDIFLDDNSTLMGGIVDDYDILKYVEPVKQALQNRGFNV